MNGDFSESIAGHASVLELRVRKQAKDESVRGRIRNDLPSYHLYALEDERSTSEIAAKTAR